MYDKELIEDILLDIVNAARKAKSRCSKFKSVDKFVDNNEEVQIVLDSICMQLIAISEAVKKIDKITDKKLLSNYKEIDWQKVAGIRDVLSYHYFDLNAEVIYSVCQNHIDNLITTLEKILEEL